MPEKNEVVSALYKLTEGLRMGTITFRQVQIAIDQNLKVVKDPPQPQHDPQIEKALEAVAKEMAVAFEREWLQMVQDVMFELGRGVALGTYGANFFKDLLDKPIK
ncbi:hypothetical protein JW977_02295 [Candidatus Falkowbacteria bacterium]|nr:hypothetical protein [Candidatus Falkowbacteria bacterium]